jgi:adenosine deaminase
MADPDLRSLPKAVLHDHLDGGLRPLTVLELADETGYRDLPASDAAGLANWFHQEDAGHLLQYLEAFVHTIGVTQTPAALERVAYECAVDLAGDGVVYAEVRFGPSLHTRQGMTREDAVEAVLAGFDRGRGDTGIVTGVIVTAMRDDDDSLEVARAGIRFGDAGVVAFDIAGPELGHPADEHLPACRLARESGLGLTIHAGEHDGPRSVWRAAARCGAQRIGHGARLIEDCKVANGEIVELGRLATMVRDQRIPLELCITSNLHTGSASTAAEHPLGPLHRAGFRVTLNTDNRLMSGISLSDEFALAYGEIGLSVAELGRVTEATLEAGFGDWSERARLIRDVVRPAYASATS